MAEGAGILLRIKGDSSDAKRALGEAGIAFSQLEGKAKSAGQGIAASFIGNLGASAVQAFTAELIQATKATIDFSARLEQTKIGFTTLMGSSAAAEKHLKELQKFAATTPFEFEGLTVASRRLQNVGLEASKVVPILTDIGNAAAAAGASSAELDSITLAFSQIIAKGKVSAEEVNQLAERGIPVWRLLSEQLGKSKAEIIDLAEKGKISSDVFLQAFSRFSQMNFGDAMEKQSHTFSGAMSSIKDAAQLASADAFKPIFEKISKFADEVASSLQSQQAQLHDTGVTVGRSLGTAIGVGMKQAGLDEPDFWKSLMPNVGRYMAEFGRDVARGARAGINSPDVYGPFASDMTPGPAAPTAPIKLDGGVDPKEAEKTAKELLDAQGRLNQAQQEKLEQAFEELQKITQDAYDKRQITAAQFRASFLQAEELYVKRIGELVGQEYDAKRGTATNKTDETAINTEETTHRENIRAASADRIKKMEASITDAIKKENDEREKDEKESAAHAIEIARARSATRLKVLENEKEIGILTQRQYIAAIYKEQVSVLEGEKSQAKSLAERELIQEKINQLKQEEARAVIAVGKEEKKNAEEAEKDFEKELERRAKAIERGISDAAKAEDRRLQAEKKDRLNRTVGSGFEISAIGQLQDFFVGEQNTAAIAGIETLTNAFSQLGQAVGQVVQAWVLYGNAGTSVRKVTAQILASIAQQAAIKAIFELAEGFAALALAFFGVPNAGPSATAHFTAAAIYGGIAGVAAVAGRAVAGDSFKKQTGSATGGAGSSANRNVQGQGSQYSGQPDAVYGGSRNAPAVKVQLEVKLRSGGVIDIVENSIKTNGRMRDLIVDAN